MSPIGRKKFGMLTSRQGAKLTIELILLLAMSGYVDAKTSELFAAVPCVTRVTLLQL